MGVAVAAKNGIKSEKEVEKGEQRASESSSGERGRAGSDLDLPGRNERCRAAGFSLHVGLEYAVCKLC